MLEEEKVEEALDKVRPALQSDGGDLELVGIGDDGIVEVQLTGACVGCPMSAVTLKSGVERMLKEELPAVEEVRAV